MKFENKRLKEDTEDLNAELEELGKLKSIVEKNLEESLASLQQEREQKHALKKELDTRIQSESMFTLQSLAGLGLGELNMGLNSKDRGTGPQDDHVGSDSPALRQIEADFTSPKKGNDKSQPAPNSGLVGDLFSEIHLTEVRKLETILEQTEIEKSKLQQQLEEATISLEAAKKEIEEQQEKINQMKAHISAIASMTANDLEAEADDEIEVDPDHPEIGTMKKNLKQQEMRYAAALKQISELQVCYNIFYLVILITWANFFQSGKSEGTLNRLRILPKLLEKWVNFTQNNGKSEDILAKFFFLVFNWIVFVQ